MTTRLIYVYFKQGRRTIYFKLSQKDSIPKGYKLAFKFYSKQTVPQSLYTMIEYFKFYGIANLRKFDSMKTKEEW